MQKKKNVLNHATVAVKTREQSSNKELRMSEITLPVPVQRAISPSLPF